MLESMSAFAKRRGVSRACVTGWRKRGLVRLEGGLVDVEATEARLAARPVRYRGGAVKAEAATFDLSAQASPATSPDDPSTWSTAEAIRQKEIASARLRQIEADTATGAVVRIEQVSKTVAAEYHVVRTALLGMASKLAHRLAAATTPQEAGALVDAEVRSALEALTADNPHAAR